MLGKPTALWIGSLALWTCLGSLGDPGQPACQAAPKSPPQQQEISRELALLERDDQQDQNDPSWTETNSLKFEQRQKQRRDRVIEIVAAGWLGSMEDFRNAALLLQHGQGSDDYLLAHILVTPAGVEGQTTARYLAAATLDRYLHSLEKPQIFSTQSASPDPSQMILVEPFDDSMSESIRVAFDLPALKRAPKPKQEKAAKSASPKDLPKLLKQAESPKPKTAAAPDKPALEPEWLRAAREVAASGALKSKQDFFLASQVLEHSELPADLLQAHVLAMAAAFQGHERGLAACASTLDRFLVASGGRARLGAVEAAAPLAPASAAPAPLHAVVLRAYGLGKEKPAK